MGGDMTVCPEHVKVRPKNEISTPTLGKQDPFTFVWDSDPQTPLPHSLIHTS